MKYTTLTSLTVAQYQELFEINTSKDEDIEKSIASVSVLTGLPRWEVEELPLPEFNKASAELAVIFSAEGIEAPKPNNRIGEKYIIQCDPRKLKAGQYIDIQHFLKEKDWVKNMDKIVASLVVDRKGKYDAKNHSQIADMIKEMKFIEVYAICVFFLNLWQSSTAVIQDYLKKELKMKLMKSQYNEIKEMDFKSALDGFLVQRGLPISKGLN